MTLADHIADVLDADPMKLSEIVMAMKRTGWAIPREAHTTFELWAILVSALDNDPRFERVDRGWRLLQEVKA